MLARKQATLLLIPIFMSILMNSLLQHHTLRSRLDGINVGATSHFRGIPYGKISTRFAAPTSIGKLPERFLCDSYGPRCPQSNIDAGHLLRIPTLLPASAESEDEFKCLNLNVVRPAAMNATEGLLPVIVWIHGGSQVVTFASAASGVCDPTCFVEDSIASGQPIVFVSLNYRLNIFAFGNGVEKNLGLQDQRLALSWIRQHIAGFGGDPSNITLAGESAGAVFCHAHIVLGEKVRRVVLSSGSLYLSPPLPFTTGDVLLESLRDRIKTRTGLSLDEAPPDALLDAMRAANVNNMWLQATSEFEGWEQKVGNAETILVGDVEYESVIWARGIHALDHEQINRLFDEEECLQSLKRLYGIYPDRPMSCVNGALDFMTDLRFALPSEVIGDTWSSVGRPFYRYIVDQANPWQKSHRAHHAVDLLLLFGGIDMSVDETAVKIGESMRKKWISFANGQAPWTPGKCYAFGPFGWEGELEPSQLRLRRRGDQIQCLKRMDPSSLARVFRRLGAGRISLLN